MPNEQPKPYDHDHEEEVTLFAATNFRNQQRKFGIKTDDRRRHIYTIGKTGMGKTTLLENLVLSDIYAGHGLCYIDPHGDAAQKLLDYIPSHRINDVVYFNPGDVDNPVGFNIFEVKDENQKHLIASGLMGVFKKIWPDVWSPRMEYILMNTILALLDAPGSSLLGITRILVDDEYRKRVVSLIQDPVVKTFWVKEFASWQDKYRTEAIAPVQNKVGQFLSSRIIRNIVAQVKSTIDMRDIMDSRKIFIVNLSKGLIGEENMRLLGGMIITKLSMSVMERVDTPEHLRQDFYLYVDEFQNFANESFASILSEARKYRLNLTVAHQYIEQMDEETRAAVFGNVGTMIVFRVGAADATLMEQEFAPTFTPEDLVNLKKFDIYLKLMIDGASSEPFSATTLPPIGNPTASTEKVVRVSRERYSRPRETIEGKIIRWSGLAPGEDKEDDAQNDILSAASELGVTEENIDDLRESSPKVQEAASPAGKKKKEAKFDIPCAVCGQIQHLTFEPDWSKPWFCKDHLDQRGTVTQPPPGQGPPPGAGTDAPPPAGPPPIKVIPKERKEDDLPPIKVLPKQDRPAAREDGERKSDSKMKPAQKPQKPKQERPMSIAESDPVVLAGSDGGGLSLSSLTPRDEKPKAKKSADRKPEEREEPKQEDDSAKPEGRPETKPKDDSPKPEGQNDRSGKPELRKPSADEPKAADGESDRKPGKEEPKVRPETDAESKPAQEPEKSGSDDDGGGSGDSKGEGPKPIKPGQVVRFDE